MKKEPTSFSFNHCLQNILCLTLCLSMITACHKTKESHYEDTFEKAEAFMNDGLPDSAHYYLSTLDSIIIYEPIETQMHHQLLTVKANDKLIITHTSDSIIKEVVRFYESYGDKDKLMEAFFYLGSVYRDMKDAPRALKAYRQAADVGKESKNYNLLRRIYAGIGYLFANQLLYEEAMIAFQESYAYYQKEDEDVNMMYALRNIARIHDMLDQKDSAAFYYEAAYDKARLYGTQSYCDMILGELGCFYVDFDQLDKARSTFSKAKSLNSPNSLLWAGRLFMKEKQLDSAIVYLNQACRTKNLPVKKSAYFSLSQIEASNKSYPLALEYAYKSAEIADSIKRIRKTEALSNVHALYNYQLTEKDNQKLLIDNKQKKQQIYILVICLLLILMVALLFFNHLKNQRRAMQLKQRQLLAIKEEQFANSLDYITENKQQIAKLEVLLQQAKDEKDTLHRQLLFSQKELLEASNQKVEKLRNEKELLELSLKRSAVYQLFHQSVHHEDKVIDETSWKELGKIINDTYPHFTEQLYILNPQLSENELRICYLIKIRMSVKDIANILHRSVSAISNSRARLYKKIHEVDGNGEMLDQFILDL